MLSGWRHHRHQGLWLARLFCFCNSGPSSISISIFISLCLSVSLSLRLSVSLSLRLSVSPSLRLVSVSLSLRLPPSLSLSLSLSLLLQKGEMLTRRAAQDSWLQRGGASLTTLYAFRFHFFWVDAPFLLAVLHRRRFCSTRLDE